MCMREGEDLSSHSRHPTFLSWHTPHQFRHGAGISTLWPLRCVETSRPAPHSKFTQNSKSKSCRAQIAFVCKAVLQGGRSISIASGFYWLRLIYSS